MSATHFVDFRGEGFWIYDVIAGVFQKYLADVATPAIGQPVDQWLIETIAQWQLGIVVAGYGLSIDDEWSQAQIEKLRGLCESACTRLAERMEISADEIEGWPMVDNYRIFPRGLAVITTDSVIQLGKAIVMLLDETLPKVPTGHWWFFTHRGRETLCKRD